MVTNHRSTDLLIDAGKKEERGSKIGEGPTAPHANNEANDENEVGQKQEKQIKWQVRNLLVKTLRNECEGLGFVVGFIG